MLASITLIPAMLGFVGYKIDKFSIHRHKAHDAARETGWHRWSRLVQRRAWPFAIGGLVILLVAAIPLFSLRLGFSDQGNNAADTTTQGVDIRQRIGPGSNAPADSVVETEREVRDECRVEAAVRSTPACLGKRTPMPSGQEYLINSHRRPPSRCRQREAHQDYSQRRHRSVVPLRRRRIRWRPHRRRQRFAGLIGIACSVIGALILSSELMAVLRSVLVPLRPYHEPAVVGAE